MMYGVLFLRHDFYMFSKFVNFLPIDPANNEDIGQQFLPDPYDHTLILYKINDIERSKFKVTPIKDTLV